MNAVDGDPALSKPPFQLRGGNVTLLILKVLAADDPSFFPKLLDKVGQAPNFYRHAPVILDVAEMVSRKPINFAEWGRRLRQHQLVPVGILNGTEEQNRQAVDAGYSVMPPDRAAEAVPAAKPKGERKAAELAAREVAAPVASGRAARVVSEPVRSGRQIYASGGDLVVLGPVSPGAELLADGHIHVYGPLRGRALAGVNGDATARIFCRSLEAELISIAGLYKVHDDIEPAVRGRDAHIYMDGERLVIVPTA
jgi:septum site-determining protein MinC